MSADKEAIGKKIREGVTDHISRVFPDTVRNIAIYNYGKSLPQDNFSSAEIVLVPVKHFISLHPSWDLVEICHDYRKNDAGFKRICESCRSGSVDLVVVHSISRLSRDICIAYYRVRQLKEYGVGVYFLSEDMYSMDESSEKAFNLALSYYYE